MPPFLGEPSGGQARRQVPRSKMIWFTVTSLLMPQTGYGLRTSPSTEPLEGKLYVCNQERLLQPRRQLLDQLTHEVTADRERAIPTPSHAW